MLSDQTAQMCKQVCIFVVRMQQSQVFSRQGPFTNYYADCGLHSDAVLNSHKAVHCDNRDVGSY